MLYHRGFRLYMTVLPQIQTVAMEIDIRLALESSTSSGVALASYYTVLFSWKKKTKHSTFIFLRNQLFTLSLFFYIHLSTMKVKTAFALLVATMAIDSRFDGVAASSAASSSSGLDEPIAPPPTLGCGPYGCGGVYPGENSCVEDTSCDQCGGVRVFGYCTDCFSTCDIGAHSCNGYHACHNGDHLKIGDHSCTGKNSCVDGDHLTIGDHSCTRSPVTDARNQGEQHEEQAQLFDEDGPCQNGNFLQIGNRACVGKLSCANGDGNVIENNACSGDNSCFAHDGGNIGSDSCVGYKACTIVNPPPRAAFTAAEDWRVGRDSCIGDQACGYQDGAPYVYMHSDWSVGKNSCKGEKACFNCQNTIGDNECNKVVICEVGDFYHMCSSSKLCGKGGCYDCPMGEHICTRGRGYYKHTCPAGKACHVTGCVDDYGSGDPDNLQLCRDTISTDFDSNGICKLCDTMYNAKLKIKKGKK